MGRGAMAAQQTLNLFILVRIRAPQLEKKMKTGNASKLH